MIATRVLFDDLLTSDPLQFGFKQSHNNHFKDFTNVRADCYAPVVISSKLITFCVLH